MQPNATIGSVGFAQSLLRSAPRSTWEQTTGQQTLRSATQSNPTVTLTRTLLATGKYGTACFDAGRCRLLLYGTGDSPLGGYLYKTLVFWDVTPVPKFQAAGHTDFEIESCKLGTFQADGQGGAEFLGGIRYFGAFQADGRTAVTFKAHLGGAFQCAGTTDVEFLVQLPGTSQGLLSASGVPPPPSRKGRDYVF